VRLAAIEWQMLDTRHWRSICDITLTLKQARQGGVPRDGAVTPETSTFWSHCDELQCKNACRHFLNLLNRAVYGGNAVRRHGKRLRVIPVIEKETDGRWHIHAAIEPPAHLTPEQFHGAINECWSRVDWSYRKNQVGENADGGWIGYMFKPWQKSGLEAWIDCIDLDSLHNPNC
jgi:hypothetical protein